MDPYLEDPAYWPDFHRRFITELADSLLAQLPPSYDARIDDQLRLVEYTEEMRTVYQDVAVVHDPSRRSNETYPVIASESGGVATLDPVTLPAMKTAEVRDVWIEIRHLPDSSVVTVIEVLSPSNKKGDGFLEYNAKRRAILERHVNLVEIDLLLSGQRLDYGPRMPKKDYYTFVSRTIRRQFVDVYSWQLRDQLPGIPIPLRSPDLDVRANLAGIFDTTYERGRYARALRYNAPVPAKMVEADQQWARDQIASRRV